MSTPEMPSDQPPQNLQDNVEVNPENAQQLLVMLKEAWTEIKQLRQQIQDQEESSTSTAKLEIEESATAQGPSSGVLIIEDSKLLQMKLRNIIESLGYRVVGIAEDGLRGVDMAVSLNPRLLILDYMLPELNGVECLRRIRTKRKDLKVIICSGELTGHSSQELAALGVETVLAKPIQLDRFVHAVKSVMGAPSAHSC